MWWWLTMMFFFPPLNIKYLLKDYEHCCYIWLELLRQSFFFIIILFPCFWLNKKPTNMCKLNILVHLKYKWLNDSKSQSQISILGTALNDQTGPIFEENVYSNKTSDKLYRYNPMWRWTGLHSFAKCVYRRHNQWLFSIMFRQNNATFTILYMF